VSTTSLSSLLGTTPPTSSSAAALSTLGTGAPLQITGLASGLNTNQIISELMSIQQVPVTALQNQQSRITATNTQLKSIQTALQTLNADAQALGDVSLFRNAQTVSSSDTTRVSATSSTGAGVGGYQVSVTQLANSAHRTFSYVPPTGNSITIDGHQTNVTPGASITDFVNTINSDSNATVYAAATDSGTVVLSNRASGGSGASDNNGTDFIQVSNGGGALTEQTGLARAGQNALYSVDGGTPGSSTTNTITGAIAGVTLSLTGVTTTSGPVTVNVGAPAPSSANIEAAVNSYVTQYNSVIKQIQTQLAQAPSSTDPTQGTLYGDTELSSLLNSMRSSMYSSNSSLPAGMASMLDLGVSTGASTGTGAISQSALAGNLTFTASTLETALKANPKGVQQVLQSWSGNISTLLDSEAGPGGGLDSRVQGDSNQLSNLANQISTMQSALADKQTQLTQQFATLEAALSTNQSQSTWLTSQIAALPTA
jgi:flagellar hook-associated protein 2